MSVITWSAEEMAEMRATFLGWEAERAHTAEQVRLRDSFAGQALSGWLAGLDADDMNDLEDEPEARAEHVRAVARTCYEYADAMLEARRPTLGKPNA